ncbi:MAG: hypothetical protein HY352_04135 [Candidatus Omnitrophica bacterium]|nr:hypothetical protein [Candidatus Omnitrophota bacterium]
MRPACAARHGRFHLALTVVATISALVLTAPPLSAQQRQIRQKMFLDSSTTVSRDAAVGKGGLIVWAEGTYTDMDLQGCQLAISGVPHYYCGGRFVVDQPSHQGSPATDGTRIVWSDSRNGNYDLFICDYDVSTANCQGAERQLTFDTSNQFSPAIDGTLIVWNQTPSGGGDSDLYLCEYDPATGRCPIQPLAVDPAVSAVRPDVSGTRIVWYAARGDDADVFACTYNPATRTCPPKLIAGGAGVQAHAAISGKRIVWQDERLDGDIYNGDIYMCEINSATGKCPPQLIAGGPQPQGAPDIDRDLIVWHESNVGTGLDIYFCEYDATSKTCPKRELEVRNNQQWVPAVADNLVVWQTDQHGPNEDVYVTILTSPPLFDHLEDQTAVVNQTFTLTVKATEPEGEAFSLAASGVPLERMGATFTDNGNGTGTFVWTPTQEQLGSYPVTFTATDVTGFSSSQIVTVKASACFIATAAYGSPMAKEIQVLQQFRDDVLLAHPSGRALVKWYEHLSPPIAQAIARHPALRSAVRLLLRPVVSLAGVWSRTGGGR